jgi:hypothetical protein
VPRLKAFKRYWQLSPPPHLLLGLMARALGLRPVAAETPSPETEPERWKTLRELAADPRSGLAIRGKSPV